MSLQPLVLALVLATAMSCDRKAKDDTPAPSPESEAPAAASPARADDAPPEPPPPTFGEQCATIGSATCKRAEACSGVSADDCTEIVVEQCCPKGVEQGNCRLSSDYPRQRLERCAEVLSRQPCADRNRNVVPAECDGLLAN